MKGRPLEGKVGLVVDAVVQNEGNGWAGSGANPWHLDSQTESVLFLTNESDKPARIGFPRQKRELLREFLACLHPVLLAFEREPRFLHFQI